MTSEHDSSQTATELDIDPAPDVATLITRLEAALEVRREQEYASIEYCPTCNEVYRKPTDQPEACFTRHTTVTQSHTNAAIGAWLQCLRFLEAAGYVDAASQPESQTGYPCPDCAGQIPVDAIGIDRCPHCDYDFSESGWPPN